MECELSMPEISHRACACTQIPIIPDYSPAQLNQNFSGRVPSCASDLEEYISGELLHSD